MNKIKEIIERAKNNPKRIVLPEANDERVIEAAKRIKQQGIANLVPLANADTEKMAQSFYELRKGKGITEDAAGKTVLENPLYLAAMMVRLGMADSFVGGAAHMTKDVIRAAMQCLGIDRSIGVVLGAFLIEIENCPYGEDGFFVFADCAVIPLPSPKQLARIAISSGDLLKDLFNIKPKP